MSWFNSGLFDSGASGLGEQAAIEAAIQTTSATEATIQSLSVAEGQTIRVECWITASMSEAKVASWHLAALFYRAVGGNVARQDDVVDLGSFMSATASWATDIEADTTNQTIDFNVTGYGSETVDWSIRINYTVLEA